ncbi:MAG TPA: DUF2085 domain-containing protein [Anaerolineales bacterium]|nr:DUF2085 domain-containing protein [Anaerolineales bacterium]
MEITQANKPISSMQPASSGRSLPVTWLGRNWIWLFTLVIGLYVGLPFLAPVFMKLGLTVPARILYGLYSLQCHQLPQRSFFLFGPRLSYSLAEIQSAWKDSTDPMVLRQFVGNPSLGWKVAWSDRMVSMYTSLPVFGLAWWGLQRWLAPRQLPRLPLWGCVLLILPMAIDGFSHFISDFSGLGQGFRDTNAWLVGLTRNALPPTFYAGDVLGSFNSWMRLISGLLFGLGVVWFSFPHFDEWFNDLARPEKSRERIVAE